MSTLSTTTSLPRVGCSVLILTKDEEINIARCLKTLSWSDDIVVLDSFSTDRTCDIAAQFPNVRIVRRKFDTWSRHSNWALEHIDFKHPWVYYSDADERVTPALRDEILAVINDPAREEVAYRLRYKNMFMGRWVHRGGLYPVWIIRLFRPDKIRYEDRDVNAHPVVQGALGELREHFIHWSFNKGMYPWFVKHNSYSSMEAGEAVRVLQGSLFKELATIVRAKEPLVRRRAFKNLSFFLPLRMVARFGYMYILRMGFLDGRAGLNYAAMISMYEYWIELKVRELQRRWHDRTTRLASRLLNEPDMLAPLTPPGEGLPAAEAAS
ncbi:MAG: glycosyltransferase family 2 protein [Phycisphaeraceae bacterium]|nr:glycosyltransferase family 2 protein [Phycisphaeraceae bacterium]MCW5754717.1 glycosyltransferase family 2 protein [Phycisphaeraceae bacterium]